MYIDRQTDRPTYAAFYLFRILFDLYRLKGMLGSTMKSPEDSSLFPFLLKILVALIFEMHFNPHVQRPDQRACMDFRGTIKVYSIVISKMGNFW